MLHPIKVDNKTYVCRFWRTFPPVLARATPIELAILRKDNDPLASPTEIQKLEVWNRVCGILKMEETTCMSCPHRQEIVRKPHCVAMLRDQDGFQTPAIDIPTVEAHSSTPHIAGLRERKRASTNE